eukprot:3456397-Pleurochrysis_carterae.AAC.1
MKTERKGTKDNERDAVFHASTAASGYDDEGGQLATTTEVRIVNCDGKGQHEKKCIADALAKREECLWRQIGIGFCLLILKMPDKRRMQSEVLGLERNSLFENNCMGQTLAIEVSFCGKRIYEGIAEPTPGA